MITEHMVSLGFISLAYIQVAFSPFAVPFHHFLYKYLQKHVPLLGNTHIHTPHTDTHTTLKTKSHKILTSKITN